MTGQPLRRPRGAERLATPAPVPTTHPVPAEPAPAVPAGGQPAPAVPTARTHGTPAAGLTGPLRQLLGPVTGSLKLLGRGDEPADATLRADWPRCQAHGVCHEIAPEVIHLDEWGYPLFDPGPLGGDELAAVRKAVQACPTLALRLGEVRPR
ncbi:MAG TPA: ferredoxin [Kineosporiaceae bacterium]